MTSVRVATRGSQLARAQADWVCERIEGVLGFETQQVIVETTGDRVLDQPLAAIGGKGLFTKEIEEALVEGRADVAVHSAKDLPSALPEGMKLVAFPERLDPRDALVQTEPGGSLASLGPGARIGTGSIRRSALLRAYREDLEIVPLRGIVPTRLRKLEEEELDGVILACAGLERLGLADRIAERLAPDTMLPAVGQGVLALEVVAGNPFEEALAGLDDPPTALAAAAERAFLEALEGDCNLPLACLCEATARDSLYLRGLLAAPSGDPVIRAECTVSAEPEAARDAGAALAREVLAGGGAEILAALQRDTRT